MLVERLQSVLLLRGNVVYRVVSRLWPLAINLMANIEGADRELRKSRDTATDERVGLFTPDKDGDTADGAGCVPVLAARRGTVCGEVGRVLRFPSTQHLHTLSYCVKASRLRT